MTRDVTKVVIGMTEDVTEDVMVTMEQETGGVTIETMEDVIVVLNGVVEVMKGNKCIVVFVQLN